VKKEYDFSKAERGRFHRLGAKMKRKARGEIFSPSARLPAKSKGK
jgi:hypothetical protein